MLSKALLSTAVTLLVTFSAQAADMKTKIEIKKAELAVSDAKSGLTSSCGNSDLNVEFDWSAYDKYDYKKMRTEQEKIIRFSGALVKEIFSDLSEICTVGEFSELYKDEVSKIKTIKISGQSDQDVRDASFKLGDDGKTLSLILNASAAYNSKYADLLKSLW